VAMYHVPDGNHKNTGNNPVFSWSPSGTWYIATQLLNNGDNSCHLRTAATSCRFAPPTGFSYWDT